VKLVRDRDVAVAWTRGGSNNHLVLDLVGKDLVPGVPSPDLSKGLEAWAKLPEKVRKPDPKKLPVIDRFEQEPVPPPKGGLILKTYVRGLQRDAKGKLHPCTRYLIPGGYGYPADPQSDHVWLTAAECKALVPRSPKKGATVKVPDDLAWRIGTFHLLNKALGSPMYFHPKVSGKLTLTVTEATAATKMRLDGKILLGGEGGDPVQFLGYASYDNKTKAFTRFDVVALGRDLVEQKSKAVRDKLLKAYEVREGWVPVLAVTFELVKGDRTMDRVPPYAIMYNSERSYSLPYFGKAK
jgi:hypothetical protein